MNALPPLDALEAVVAAAKEGSFSAAAAGLGLTHGAVSRRIAAVEAWAGYRIFDRHGRGVRPTVAGHALLAQVEKALALLDDGRRAGGGASRRETVLVGIVPSFARLWLFPNLARLEGAPPDLRIEVDVDDRFMTLSGARVAIRYGSGGWPDVISRPLFREFGVPVAAPSVAALLGDSDDPTRLLDFPILHDATTADWTAWFGHAGAYYVAREEDRIFEAYDLALAAVGQGLGIGLLREPYASAYARQLGLVPVSKRRLPLSKRFHLLTSEIGSTPAVERLAARILALMGPDSPAAIDG